MKTPFAILFTLITIVAVWGESGDGGIESIERLDHQLPKDCIGNYNEYIFQELQRICNWCYKIFNSEDLYGKCREKCYTSEPFEFCAMASGSEVAKLAQYASELKGVKNHSTFIGDQMSKFNMRSLPDDCEEFQIYSERRKVSYADLICRFCGQNPQDRETYSQCRFCGEKVKDPDMYSQCRDRCYTTDVFLNCGKDLGIKHSDMLKFQQLSSRHYRPEPPTTTPSPGRRRRRISPEPVNRDFPDECRGLRVETSFTKLQQFCETCYARNQNKAAYNACRQDCFTSEAFTNCNLGIWANELSKLRKLAESLRSGE